MTYFCARVQKCARPNTWINGVCFLLFSTLLCFLCTHPADEREYLLAKKLKIMQAIRLRPNTSHQDCAATHGTWKSAKQSKRSKQKEKTERDSRKGKGMRKRAIERGKSCEKMESNSVCAFNWVNNSKS